ncbi:MAG: MBL fold metallo-hydrolase [Williamsia sp.]|nr:MBL fold metallo-hydrolase [Williamsia sp.]
MADFKKEKPAYKLLAVKRVPGRRRTMLLIAIALLTMIGCRKDDKTNADEIKLQQVLDALGGKDIINQVHTVSYTANAASFEYEQAGPTVADPINVNNHNYNFSAELNTRKVRLEYSAINFHYPFVYDAKGALIVINDKEGFISGEYNWSSYYLGTVAPAALFSSRIEAILKNQMMADPLELLKEVLSRQSASSTTTNGAFSIPTRIEGLNIELVIDPATHLPSRARIPESDYLLGDVSFEIAYEDWVNTSGARYPSKLSFTLHGKKIKSEVLTNIVLNPALPANNFSLQVPYERLAYNYDEGNLGIYASQWYHRLFAGGIGLDQPLNNGALVLDKFDLSTFGMPSQMLGPNLRLIGRPDASNWAAAINTSTGILVVEAPLNPGWTRSILNAVHTAFPGKKIIGVVSSHTHYDHFGGIREMAQEAGTVYVGKGGTLFADSVFNSKHTLLPDKLSLNATPVAVKEVTGITSVDNGAVKIHLLKTKNGAGNPFSHDNPHSWDMVVVYVPEYEALIQADFLYAGIFLKIWKGPTAHSFTGPAREELKKRANFLLDYIQEKNLKVSKIIGIHGGLATLDDLKEVAK